MALFTWNLSTFFSILLWIERCHWFQRADLCKHKARAILKVLCPHFNLLAHDYHIFYCVSCEQLWVRFIVNLWCVWEMDEQYVLIRWRLICESTPKHAIWMNIVDWGNSSWCSLAGVSRVENQHFLPKLVTPCLKDSIFWRLERSFLERCQFRRGQPLWRLQ